MKMIDSGF